MEQKHGPQSGITSPESQPDLTPLEPLPDLTGVSLQEIMQKVGKPALTAALSRLEARDGDENYAAFGNAP